LFFRIATQPECSSFIVNFLPFCQLF